jgi:hypothetical protein
VRCEPPGRAVTLELAPDEVKQIVRLVYVAEGEGRASAADWELAKRLAAECGFPTQAFYWPRS